MNLQELKHIWQEADSQQEFDHFSTRELRQLLQEKSNRELGRINRTLVWEWGLIALMGALLVAGMVWAGISLATWEILGIAAFIGVSARFYQVKFRALNENPLTDTTLKAGLKHLILAMDRYIRFYQIVSIFWVPLVAAVSMVYGMSRYANHAGLDMGEIPAFTWGMVGVIMVIFAGGMAVFARWYTRHFYIRRSESLKAALAELSPEDEFVNGGG